MDDGAGVNFTAASCQKTAPGSDRLVDALLVSGTPDVIAGRLGAHLDAGADHVPIQLLTPPDRVVPALAELAGPLGLN